MQLSRKLDSNYWLLVQSVQSHFFLLGDNNIIYRALLALKLGKSFAFTYSYIQQYMEGNIWNGILGHFKMQLSHPKAPYKYSSGIFQSCQISPQFRTSNKMCSHLLKMLPLYCLCCVSPLLPASHLSPGCHIFFFPSSGDTIRNAFTSAIMWPSNKALKHPCNLCRREAYQT